MKITCPNCQEKYHINETRIPPGAKAAKCRACGHLIPLKAVPPSELSEETRIIKILCRYCGQIYNLRQNKIPAAATAIKCKSCGHPVSLKQETVQARVHSLTKLPSRPASATPATKPIKPHPRQDDILGITCTSCRKKYKIRQNKIPPNAIAVKCKACGQQISLPPLPAIKAAEDRGHREGQYTEKPILKPHVIPVKKPPPIQRSRKKIWLSTAGVILIVIFGILAGLKLMNVRLLNQKIPVATETGTETSALLNKEPFLALNLNVPLILQNVENRVEKDKKPLQFQLTLSLLKSLNIKRLELYLYTDTEHQVLPVILARGGSRKHFEKILSGSEPFNKYFEYKSGGNYRMKKEALSGADKYNFPREPYQVTLLKKGAVFAPVSFSNAITGNKGLFQNTQVARFIKTIATPQNLAVAAIRIPEDIQNGWEKNIRNYPALETNPQAAMIAGVGVGIMAQLTSSLKPVEVLALGFRFAGSDRRTLSYAQQFRPGVDGKAIYRKLNSGNLREVEVDGVIRKLIELFQNRRYQHKLRFTDNRLVMEFSWSKKDDKAFLAALSEATIGQLLAGSMKLDPTKGPVETQYVDDPHFFTDVDADRIKPGIPQIVKQSLFPGHYWNFGDQPQMTLDLDTVDIANAALAELTYEVRSVRSPDGKEVLRVEKNKFKAKIHPGSTFPGSLSLSVKKGTPPDALKTAKIHFHLSLPVALQVFKLNTGDIKGSTKTADGVRVTLGRLEKDVAQISYSGAKSVRLIAYDQSGKALASRESMSTSSSVSARFQGVIDTLKVVATDKMLEYPFDIEVDLNGGKELALSRKPEIPLRIRYNHNPIPTYIDFANQDLDNLAVIWKEADQNAWTDNLFIQLPKGPFSGYADWEVHFFGKNKPQILSGNAIQGMQDVSFRLDKGKLKNTNAAFGKVQLNIQTDLTLLMFVNKDGGNPEPRLLPSGDTVSVSFNKNEVTYSAGNANVIRTSAYDARGKRLKQDNYTGTKGSKRIIYFWGQPAKFEIDVAMRTIKRQIPFDIKKRPLDENAYQAHKRTVENHREIVTTLKSMDRARRRDRSYYGDDLAGLFYLYDRNKKKPMELIDKTIAHSDPAGQKRFRYRVKPYKGYYFTVLSGAQVNGVNQHYKHRSKKTNFIWQKGTVTTSALSRHPDLVAIPQEKSQPTFFLQWGQVYMKSLYGVKLDFLPENYSNKGWVEAKFLGN